MRVDIKVIVELDNKEQYEFNSGAEAYIFHTGMYHDMLNKYGIQEMLKYVSYVFDSYLADSNRTPLGDLSDYVADNWDSIKVEQPSRYELLDDFYATYEGV